MGDKLQSLRELHLCDLSLRMFLLSSCKQYPLEFCREFYHPESTSRAYLEFQRQDVCGICFSQVFQKAMMPIGRYISCHSKSIVLSCIQMEQTGIRHTFCSNTSILLCFHLYMEASFLLQFFLS